MNVVNFLKSYSTQTVQSLSRIAEEDILKQRTYRIDCRLLNDYTNVDVRSSDSFRELFDELQSIEGPVLYWFSIVSPTDTTSILEAIKKYKQDGGIKSIPAIKLTNNLGTKTLYVGKVKNTFWGRLIQHMGYYRTPATQGLQLYYWAKSISLDLELNIIAFNKELENEMSIFENALAKELQPLVGKHK